MPGVRWAILLAVASCAGCVALSTYDDTSSVYHTSLAFEVEGKWLAHRGTYSYSLDLLPDGTYTRLHLDGTSLGNTETGIWSFRVLIDPVHEKVGFIVGLRPTGSGQGIYLSLYSGSLCPPPPTTFCYLREPYGYYGA